MSDIDILIDNLIKAADNVANSVYLGDDISNELDIAKAALRAEFERMTGDVEQYRQTLVDNEAFCASLTAENERLLAEVERLTDYRWTPVTDHLPDRDEVYVECTEIVLAYDPAVLYSVPAYVEIETGKWFTDCGNSAYHRIYPTHWRPMPDAPKLED